MEIAELVSQGATNKELAERLFISENTVKVHMKNILQKMELKNRQQLAVIAASHFKKGK
jgi:two-component system, NarL family, nitrate/nitrite response regulator NarL